MSVAFDIPTPTLHRFVEARACTIPGPGGGRAYEFIFQCCETGFERRWGVVDRNVSLPEDAADYVPHAKFEGN